jgi:transposase-like protein
MMTLANKRIEWKSRLDAWKSSGMSVAAWCREQGLKDHQMYYWIQKFTEDQSQPEQEAPRTEWLAMTLENEFNRTRNEGSVLIHCGSLSVEARPGVDLSLLSDVVHLLQSQC